MKLLPTALLLSTTLLALSAVSQVLAQDETTTPDSPGQIQKTQTAPEAPVAGPPCIRFSHCIQETLNHKSPVDKVLYSTHALKYWTEDLPLRDLVNALKLRSEALIELHSETLEKQHAEALAEQPISGNNSNDKFNPLDYAEADYNRFLGFYPDHWLPLSGLARIAELRGDMKTARGYYWKSIQTDQVRAWRNLADFHFRTKEWQSAVNDLSAAIKKDDQLMLRKINIEPNDRAQLYMKRAEAYNQLAERQKAFEDQKSACALDNNLKICTAEN